MSSEIIDLEVTMVAATLFISILDSSVNVNSPIEGDVVYSTWEVVEDENFIRIGTSIITCSVLYKKMFNWASWT